MGSRLQASGLGSELDLRFASLCLGIKEDASNFENRCGFRAFYEPQRFGCQAPNVGVPRYAGRAVKSPRKA